MGTRLKGLREDRGLTQTQLADRAGVPLGSLRNYEQGHRTPLLDQAAKLAVALGVSLDVLAGIKEPAGQAGRPKKPRKGRGAK
jgi:transcriptional regulator with XRE-family HTH domain